MKTLAILSLAALPIFGFADDAKDAQIHTAWMKLSAVAQNVAWAFRRLSPTGQPDPSMLADELKAIDVQLEALTKAGELAEEKVTGAPSAPAIASFAGVSSASGEASAATEQSGRTPKIADLEDFERCRL